MNNNRKKGSDAAKQVLGGLNSTKCNPQHDMCKLNSGIRSGSCLYPFPDCLLCVCVMSCAGHTPSIIMLLTKITGLRDRGSETANIQHTNMLSAHQFNTDDEGGRGVFIVQNWDFWLRSFLEGYEQKEDTQTTTYHC